MRNKITLGIIYLLFVWLMCFLVFLYGWALIQSMHIIASMDSILFRMAGAAGIVAVFAGIPVGVVAMINEHDE